MIFIKHFMLLGAAIPTALFLLLQTGSCGKSHPSRSQSANTMPTQARSTANQSSMNATPTSNAGAAKSRALPEGTWGGTHVALTVRTTGAEIEFDCAHGAIGRPIVLDAKGHFETKGTFVREGGPVSVPVNGDFSEKRILARYRGRVEGEAMVLTVTTASGNTVLGEFNLAKGKPPLLTKCY